MINIDKVSKKIVVLCVALLTQACCLFGTYEGQESVWVALKNPRPTTSSSIQHESCIVEDKKTCSESYATACSDLASGKKQVTIVNQVTGDPLNEREINRLRDDCGRLKSNPDYIDDLCQIRRTVDSCMEKNGYKHGYQTTTQCSSMKVL